MAKIFIDKCPPLKGYPNKSPPPGQKLGCKSPRTRANVWYKSPGVRGGMVMDEIHTCIITKQTFTTLLNIISQLLDVFGTHTSTSGRGGGGGGVDPTSHELEDGRTYNLQLWQTMQTIYEI